MKVNFRQGVVSYQTGGFLQIIGNDVSLLATNRSVTITVAHKDTDYTHSEDKSVNNAWAGPFIEPKYWLYWNFDPLTFARTFGTTTLEPVAQSIAPGNGDSPITGVVTGTGSPITSAFIIDGSYSLSIGKPFAVIGSTANDGNYTVSSISIGGSPLQTTIYVNEPVNSVVVDGSVTLDVDSDGNPLKVEGRHWYDTSIGVHYVLNGGVWQSVLRVFAAQLLNGNTFISASQLGDFSGTQIGNNTEVFSGRILFDESSVPIRRDDGTFFTTEDQFFTNQSRVDALRLESNITRAQCIAAALSAFSVVAWTNDGQVNAAQYDDVGSTVVGLLTENLTNLEVGGIIVQGSVTNPDWNWTAGGNPVPVGSSLWVENGLLTATDPNLNDPVTYPIARVPVARVLDKDTIIFEQGLGGVGVQGPQGLPADLIAAGTTDLGSVTLLTASSDSARAFVISDTDSRLTDARTPLTHAHQAADVTFQPGGGLASTDVQSAVVELGTDKLNLSGGSLTGFLTLNADPTALAHAASKQYVDNNIAAVDHTNILNIGTNTHAQIDTHIADGTVHFTEANIDHTNILNIGTNTHVQIDTHIADGTTHFTEANIDHTNISNIGTNTHTQIDTHIADPTIHFNTLDGLSDVNTSGSPAVTDGQMLTWNNSAGYWENATVDILVFADKAEAVAFVLTAADAGRKIFINSSDGGEFTIEYNATPGTYADNGGVYCGTEFIPTAGDGTIGIVRDYSGAVNVSWFGAKGDGTTDDTTAIQTTINVADGDMVFLPLGIYLVSSPLANKDAATVLRLTGDTRLTRITVGGSYTGYIINTFFGYELSNLIIVGSNTDGCYGIGADGAGQGAGNSKLENIDIRNTDQAIRFDFEFEHPILLMYTQLYIQIFRTAGINLGGTSGAASSGESSFGLRNCVVTNAATVGISYSPSISVDTPDSTHDRITWTGTVPEFGFTVMRSADGATGWHVPPNWTSHNFTALTFDAEKIAAETWFYDVVRSTVGINVRRAKDVNFSACQTEYVGIGILNRETRALIINGAYGESRDTNPPVPNFTVIYNSTVPGCIINAVWADNYGYAVFNGSNSATDLSTINAINCEHAIVGQGGSTDQRISYRNLVISGTTPAIFNAPSNGAQDYNFSAREYTSSDFVEKLSHTTKVSKELWSRNVLKSTWKYDTTEGAGLDGLNALSVAPFSKSLLSYGLNIDTSLYTTLTSGVATTLLTFDVPSNGVVGLNIAYGISVTASSVSRQSVTGVLNIGAVSAAGTVAASINDTSTITLQAGTLTTVFSVSVSSSTVSVKCLATTSLGTPTMRLYLTPVNDVGTTNPTSLTQS